MTAVAGLRGTGDFATDERPKNFRETILFLDPNGDAPLTALLSKMGSEDTDDPEFAWYEERMDAIRLQLNGAIADGIATAFTVDADSVGTIAPANQGLSGALSVVAGDLLLYVGTAAAPVNTGLGEIVMVTANPSTDTGLTVARGQRGSTGAAMADDGILVKIGNVNEEGATSPKAKSRNPVKQSNFCQIFRTPYSITNTTKATKFRTGDPLKNERKRKMFDHSVDMEEAFMWGRKFEDTGANGKPRRSTGGLNSFITTNRTVFGGGGPAFTEDNFLDAISPMFTRSGAGAGNERIGFVGNTALTALNKLARNSSSSRITHAETIKVYGMALQKWILPQGTVYLRTHPLMNTDPVFKRSGFFINPKGLKYRPLRDTKFKDNIQANNADSQDGEWLTEAGLEVQHESTMAYLGNLS